MFSKALVSFILVGGFVFLLIAARGAIVVGRTDDARNRKIDDELDAA
jgi:hypothetical protein